jgi:murein DD-endopeptidase MepM/ murein hydrolase activator NlpD
MNTLPIIYLLKVAFAFVVLYFLYWMFFRRHSFHKLNRILLVSIPIVALILPLVNFDFRGTYPTVQVVFEPFSESFQEVSQKVEEVDQQMPAVSRAVYVYWLGTGVFFLWIALMLIKMLVAKLSSFKGKVGTNEVYFRKKGVPFSFFRWIFLPVWYRNTREAEVITAHERAHAQQWHTLDLLWIELFHAFFWFVPFVFSFKRSLKTVHEFLADEQALKCSGSKQEYLQILSRETVKNSMGGVISHFNVLTLKNRIKMISNKKSNPIKLTKYFVLVPVIGILLMAFSPMAGAVLPKELPGTEVVLEKDNIPSIHPVKGECRKTSGFGIRMHPIKKVKKMHNGVDFAAKAGTPIVATADGKVVRKEYLPKSYGRIVAIQHSQGYVTVYSQMSEFNTALNSEVKKGDIIGYVGQSGISTGPHLHYEVRKDGEYLDPEKFIKK